MTWPLPKQRESASHRSFTVLAARYWPDVHGGVENRLKRFTEALAELETRVEVWTENRCGADREEKINDHLFVWREVLPTPRVLWRWPTLPRLRWWTRRMTRRMPVGYIWATDPVIAVAAIRAGHAGRLIYNPAGCVAAMNEVARLYPHVQTMKRPKVLEKLDAYAYHNSQKVVVSSQNVKDQYTRFIGPHDQTIVQHLAASMDWHTNDQGIRDISAQAVQRHNWQIEDRDFVIGFVGRLDPCKNVDFLFDAVTEAGIADRVRILIVGDGPDEQRLQKRAAALHLSHRIIWTGRVNDPSSLYGLMDAFVLPSVFEAFGQVLVDAMAAGVPALARVGNNQTTFTAAGEIITHDETGFVVHPHQPGDLGEHLRYLLENPDARKTMAHRAHVAYRDSTWRQYAREIIKKTGDHTMIDLPALPETPMSNAA